MEKEFGEKLFTVQYRGRKYFRDKFQVFNNLSKEKKIRWVKNYGRRFMTLYRRH